VTQLLPLRAFFFLSFPIPPRVSIMIKHNARLIGVLLVDQSITSAGIEQNLGLVLGLSAGRKMLCEHFGPDVSDADGRTHPQLTNSPHFVRKCSANKLRELRDVFASHPELIVVDYTEAAATSDYAAYAKALSEQAGDQVVYRAVFAFGPEQLLTPLTKNLSRL
jgi:hypothetical protein